MTHEEVKKHAGRIGALARLLKRLYLTDSYVQQVEADYERMQAPEYSKPAREAEASLPTKPSFRRFGAARLLPHVDALRSLKADATLATWLNCTFKLRGG